MKKLSQCKQGDSVKIASVSGSGPLRRRLLDMGFMKGTVLEVIRYAPLKDPMEVEIRNTHISLRVKEAELITIEPYTEQNNSPAHAA